MAVLVTKEDEERFRAGQLEENLKLHEYFLKYVDGCTLIIFDGTLKRFEKFAIALSGLNMHWAYGNEDRRALTILLPKATRFQVNFTYNEDKELNFNGDPYIQFRVNVTGSKRVRHYSKHAYYHMKKHVQEGGDAEKRWRSLVAHETQEDW